MKNRPTPEVCPVCGEDVPPKAKSCPNCGACHESGWSDDAESNELDLPGEGGEEFDYDRWLAREEGREQPPGGVRPFWKIVAVLLLLGLFWFFWKWIYRVGSASWF
jgi:hypothetical protein